MMFLTTPFFILQCSYSQPYHNIIMAPVEDNTENIRAPTIKEALDRHNKIQALLKPNIIYQSINIHIKDLEASPKNRPFDPAHASDLSHEMEINGLDPSKCPLIVEFKNKEGFLRHQLKQNKAREVKGDPNFQLMPQSKDVSHFHYLLSGPKMQLTHPSLL